MRSLTRPSSPCAPKLVGLCAPSSQFAAGPSPEAGRGVGSTLWAKRLCAAETRSPASCSP
ncbi:Unconventional Myosin-Ixa, partial [Manis pentadactyla]